MDNKEVILRLLELNHKSKANHHNCIEKDDIARAIDLALFLQERSKEGIIFKKYNNKLVKDSGIDEIKDLTISCNSWVNLNIYDYHNNKTTEEFILTGIEKQDFETIGFATDKYYQTKNIDIKDFKIVFDE